MSASRAAAPSGLPMMDGGPGTPAAPCSTTSPAALTVGQRIEVETGARYAISGAALTVCVESAAFPRDLDRHHHLSASFVLEGGSSRARFTPRPDQRIAWHGYAIFFGLARASYTAPGVWIRVEREPDTTP